MSIVESINKFLNNIVWGWPGMILLLGIGLYLTLCTGFLQFRKFGYAMKNTIGKIFEKKPAAAGSITSFQAVCTALAATVGTGNVAGVAGAIALGGPGAVFWMWISALLGMCTKFAEIVLAVNFRERNKSGEWVGGPMYYIRNGLGKKWNWLAALFAGFAALAAFGIGNATQVGSIKDSINSMLYGFGVVPSTAGVPVVNAIFGVVMMLVLLLVLLGGMKRLAGITELLVPFMAILYVLLGIGVVALNLDKISGIFASIFKGAFTPAGVTGGVVGSIAISMKRGISRGIFSNEAGLGSAPIAHASADTDHPVKQGLFGIFEVFADTIVICTLTALIVLCAGQNLTYGVQCGAEMTISAFTATYGSWASIFGAVAIVCFAFSTVLGWGLYGMRSVEFLLGSKAVKPYTVIFCLIAILGATADLGLLWDISDTLNGLMAIPNLIAVALLSPVVFKLTKQYFAKK